MNELDEIAEMIKGAASVPIKNPRIIMRLQVAEEVIGHTERWEEMPLWRKTTLRLFGRILPDSIVNWLWWGKYHDS